MASLHEYFVKNGLQSLTNHQTWPLTNKDGAKLGDVTARLHLDFNANAKYVSFFIPDMPDIACPEAIVLVLNKVAEILAWPETNTGIRCRFAEEKHDGKELVFTGQIYLYSERPVPQDLKDRMTEEAKTFGHRLTFRSTDYVNARNKAERPRAFISHDWRDKVEIAEPIALQLMKMMCPVWYDEFSLRVGDSLRESIERGLKECSKCILVLTPNFIANEGWAKREYDSIFTRELIEKQKVILPVWHEISPEQVYEFSPMLKDRVAVQWSLGLEEVTRRLFNAIEVGA
jgi:hypothetical protein